MLRIVNPATGTLIQGVPCDSADSIREKFKKAADAHPGWAKVRLEERLGIIAEFRRLIAGETDRLAAILTSEVGKPIRQSRNEVIGTLIRIDYFVEAVGEVLQEEVVSSGKVEERISMEPLGVVANISAWNYPFFIGSNVFLPALLTGNCILYKPSEYATLTGLEIAALLHRAGIPNDVFLPICGGGEVGSELLKHPFQGIFFTGSYATGLAIAKASAAHLPRLQLELGGKDPVYVCDDVSLPAAVREVADGAFYNTGQSCCSVERVYVHQRIFDSFVEEFVKEVRGFVVGDPSEEKTYIGPLTRPAHVVFLEEQVADAVSKGAKALCGGKRMARPGNYFEPTVLVDVDHTMRVMREETFGPVIGIQSVTDDNEATERMNDTVYGLTAGVYTRNAERAKEILRNVRAGSVYWNCCDRVNPRLPWSGRGHSGVGCTLSKYGILQFLQTKAWHLRTAD